ncbi:MAG: hypothetical protein A3F78_08780 [Burkholderiales bacterium RIFCSPLOWO2_12_FULL_61_40]|nr:MAG: hypothetical protein A3F78_08780 [Burkholderiales bacterium RIFCSPLOWO2_12_FULL_61_40]
MTFDRTPLRSFLNPTGIALFGASPVSGTLGYGLVQSLAGGEFSKRVHYINPKHVQIDGQVCVASLEQVQGPISLALIATPLSAAPDIVEACGRRGISSAIVYSSGLHDSATHDAQYLRLIQAAGARAKVRLLGPRAMGFVLPHAGLNTTPVPKAVPKGNLGFVSHSNSICASIFDWSHNNEFGFSAVFCPGESLDLELPEILDYLTTDARTETILLYLEGIRDARRFLSAVRAAASVKPVIAVKAGHQPGSARFAASHSGGACGDDDVFDAALRRAGVLRVKSIGDMFSAARALGNPCKPRGNRLAVVSNGGGPIVMAADCAAALGIDLSALAAPTVERLNIVLPTTWTRGNPVDVLFDTGPERFVGALSACMDDPHVDGVLAVLSPNTFVDPCALAHATIEVAQRSSKPLLTCWLGEVDARPARAAFAQARLPTFRCAESAVAGFSFMVNWVRNQALLQETPAALSAYQAPNSEMARSVIARSLAEGRSHLMPMEARDVLAAFHIPVTQPHPMVQGARKLHVAIRPDAVFGPVISLSEGGAAGEIYGIRSTALPPLNPRLVQEMVDEEHIARLLGPLGPVPGVAQGPLRDILLRVSEMASELACLHALDIRSLMVDDERAVVFDAAIEVRPAVEGARYQHMAICPYPTQFTHDWRLKDGSSCTIRAIRPEDALALQGLVRQLSRKSKYFRFFNMVNELPQKQLARYTQIDYARELTLVATGHHEGGDVMLGEANYSILADAKTCEFALVVADHMAGKGLGGRLMRCLMDAAREQGLSRIQGEVLNDNESMLALMEALDFTASLTDDGVLEVSRRL